MITIIREKVAGAISGLQPSLFLVVASFARNSQILFHELFNPSYDNQNGCISIYNKRLRFKLIVLQTIEETDSPFFPVLCPFPA
jgi:hypothetical protein